MTTEQTNDPRTWAMVCGGMGWGRGKTPSKALAVCKKECRRGTRKFNLLRIHPDTIVNGLNFEFPTGWPPVVVGENLSAAEIRNRVRA